MTARPSNEQPPTIKQVEGIVARAVSEAKKLQRATHLLPSVDSQGNSKCPFAKELYAKHEEQTEKVQGLLAKLHDCLGVVQEQIRRHAHNVALISAGKGRLNRDRPRAHFSVGEVKLADLYKRCLQLRGEIEQAIHLADEALREASTKRFPGLIPHKKTQPGSVASPFSGRNSAGDGNSGADRELPELFEMDRRKHGETSGDGMWVLQ